MFASRLRPTHLLTTALLGLCASVSALEMTPTTRISVPGAAALTGLAALPDGSRLLCLGSRWVRLGGRGEVLAAAALPAACTGLSLSPDGKAVLTTTATGLSVWTVADGKNVLSVAGNLTNRAGFLPDGSVIWATDTDIRRADLKTAAQTMVRSGGAVFLVTSPDGKRAVISDGKKVQMLRLPDMVALSGMVCDTGCAVQNAHFSADGDTAAVLVGSKLYGLRNGIPSSTIWRDAPEGAVGLPQPDNTVLTVGGGNAESHDLQTGRREEVLLSGDTQGKLLPQAWPAGNRVLVQSEGGELLDSSPEFKDIKRLTLPASVTGGALLGGQTYALSSGNLYLGSSLGSKKLAGTYWAVQGAGQVASKGVWALASAGDGGLRLGTLSAEKFTPVTASRTETHLALNFWGNAAALWNDDHLNVYSAGKLGPALKLALAGAQVSLSPDATRALVLPATADGYLVTLKDGKKATLPKPKTGRWQSGEWTGKGVLTLLDMAGNVALYRANEATPYATIPGAMPGSLRPSPDSRWLAVAVQDAQGIRLNLVNTETGKTEAQSAALAAAPSFVAWSADSKSLAVGASLLNELASVTVFGVK